jgi:hypothetical protein
VRPDQRDAATAALQQLAADGRVRVVDPTVRKTLVTLAELGLLRPAVKRSRDRSPKTELAIGSTRRLQAMSREGWSQTDLAEALGVSVDIVKLHRRGNHRRIGRELSSTIRELYEADEAPFELSEQTITRATKAGWATREQWAGLDLDDPGVQPTRFLV